MFGAMGLVHAACGVILMSFAIGFYRHKPDIQKYESILSGMPLFAQAMFTTFLIIILAGGLGFGSGPVNVSAQLIDTFGLIVHEGGHFLMSWAGDFIHTFGGTLFEVGVPAGLAIWFLLSNCYRLGACALAWMSVALFSVARYAGDAQDLELNLLGASGSLEDKMIGHDWYNMLGSLGLLDSTPVVSDVIWSMALVAGLAAIALSSWAVYIDHRAKAVFDQKLS